MIANTEVVPDGKLTDKGKVSVQAGSVVAKTLHEHHASDYDQGKSFGLGVSLSKKTTKEGDTEYGVGMPVVASFNDQARDILPTIGGGDIRLTNAESYSGESSSTSTTSSSSSIYDSLAGLNRNLSSHIGHTIGEHASLKASIPVSDIWQALTTSAKPQDASKHDQ